MFVSYARANEAAAKRVQNGLKAGGFDAWRDDQLPAHRAYSEVIEQRLRGASAVVVLWSKEAAQSQWVRAEADFARNEGKLVQAQLDDTLPPMPFNQIQCADLRGWRGNRKHKGWAKLAASVDSVVSGEKPQPAEPASLRRGVQITRRQAIAALAAILLVIAGAALLVPRLFGGGDESPRVAVLPFESVGGSDEALVAGIWEDTRQALSRNPQLVVLGPNTSQEIAQSGGGAASKAADYLVEASVRTAGDRVRVSTSLVRSEDGAQVWSQTFDRKLDNVFALQSQIAQEIEGRIRGRLAREGGVKPENIATSGEVYALYADARAKIRNRDPVGFQEALEQLEKVVQLDPNFAPGWATLSVTASFGVQPRVPRNEDERQRQETRAPIYAAHERSAEAYARRAIALAPNLAAGHAALGLALGRGPAAKAALERAVSLDPGDIEALNWLAGQSEDPAEKLRLFSRIVEIEPLWWPAILNKLRVLLDAGDYPAAEQEKQRLERLGATMLAGMAGVAIEDSKGDLSAAAKVGIRTFNAIGPNERAILGYELAFLLMKLGYFDEVSSNFDVPPAAPFLWRNDPRGLDMVEALDFPPTRFFSQGPLPLNAARVYLLSGRGARLAELYRAAASSPAEFETLTGPDILIDLAPVIALALRQSGDSAEAESLLLLAESRLRRPRKVPPELKEAMLARIAAVQGRKAEALSRLASAVRNGWIPGPPGQLPDIATDPPLALLKGERSFEASRRHILDYIAKERRELGPVRLQREPRQLKG